jgi:hypothetical protein
MTLKYSVLATGCVMLPFGLLHAQVVTNIPQRIAEALAAHGPVSVTRTISVPRTELRCTSFLRHFNNQVLQTVSLQKEPGPKGPDPRTHCSKVTVFDQVKQTTQEVLTVSNIRVTSNDEISFEQRQPTNLTDRLIVQEALVQDCTSFPATQTVTLSQAFQRSSSIAFSKTVANSASSQISFSLKLSDAFTIGGNIQIGSTTTTGTVNTSGTQDTVTRTQTGAITLQPKTAVLAQLQMFPVNFVVPFHTTVTVDADLSPNDLGDHLLSDLLGKNARTFPISGTIEANDASAGILIFSDIQFDPTKCHGSGVITESHKPGSDDKLLTRP